MTPSTNTGKGRIMTGKVISTKMTKTVIVQVVRTYAHKLYKRRSVRAIVLRHTIRSRM